MAVAGRVPAAAGSGAAMHARIDAMPCASTQGLAGLSWRRPTRAPASLSATSARFTRSTSGLPPDPARKAKAWSTCGACRAGGEEAMQRAGTRPASSPSMRRGAQPPQTPGPPAGRQEVEAARSSSGARLRKHVAHGGQVAAGGGLVVQHCGVQHQRLNLPGLHGRGACSQGHLAGSRGTCDAGTGAGPPARPPRQCHQPVATCRTAASPSHRSHTRPQILSAALPKPRSRQPTRSAASMASRSASLSHLRCSRVARS